MFAERKTSLGKMITALALTLSALVPFAAGALTFSPAHLVVGVAPGTEKQSKVLLLNESDDTIKVHVEAVNFYGGEAAGMPVFTDATTPSGIMNNVLLSSTDFQLDPKETREYTVTVRAPADMKPGGYYGAVHFASTTLGDSNVVAITGPLLFVVVPGENDAHLELTPPSVPTGIQTGQPSSLPVTLTNDSTTFALPSGSLIIRNAFGSPVKTYPLNREGHIILPGETRTFIVGLTSETTNEIQDELQHFGLGAYRLSLHLSYGQGKFVDWESETYWVAPPLLLGLAAGASVFIVIFLGILFAKRRV